MTYMIAAVLMVTAWITGSDRMFWHCLAVAGVLLLFSITDEIRALRRAEEKRR